MLKRLGLGLLKGLLIGGAIGAGLQFGLPELGVTGLSFAGLLGFLIAMGAGGTTGVFAGKPPWQEGAWIEATLKGMVGVGLGALLYWVGSKWGSFAVPFPGTDGAQLWTALPAIYAPAVAGVYGALVELDNTGDDNAKKPEGKSSRARVAVDDDLELAEETRAGASAKKKKKKA